MIWSNLKIENHDLKWVMFTVLVQEVSKTVWIISGVKSKEQQWQTTEDKFSKLISKTVIFLNNTRMEWVAKWISLISSFSRLAAILRKSQANSKTFRTNKLCRVNRFRFKMTIFLKSCRKESNKKMKTQNQLLQQIQVMKKWYYETLVVLVK